MWFLKFLVIVSLLIALACFGIFATFWVERLTAQVEAEKIVMLALAEQMQETQEQLQKYKDCETQFTRWINRHIALQKALTFVEVHDSYPPERRIDKAIELSAELGAANQAITYACKD